MTTEGDDGDDLLAAALAAAGKLDLAEIRAEVEAELDDPTLKEIIEAAVAPFVGVLTQSTLADARGEIALHFLADPTAAKALHEARVAAGSRVVGTRNPEALAEAAGRARRVASLGGRKAGKA